MKKILIALSCMCHVTLYAQFALPDAGFENWNSFTSGTGTMTYEEPASGWWGTLNKLSFILQGNPVTVTKTTYAHGGTHAARLETKLSGGTLLLPGLLFAGYFDENSPSTNYIRQGRPYTDQPLKIKGHYQYTSVSGDSCGIYVLLSRYNSGLSRRDTIATAVFSANQTTGAYAYLERDFQYKVTGIAPDTMFLTIISSLGWNNFANAQAGSTLWIDDLALEYTSGAETYLLGAGAVTVCPNPAATYITVRRNAPGTAAFELFRAGSQPVLSMTLDKDVTRVGLAGFPAGLYLYRVTGLDGTVSAGKIILIGE